ncbi:poly-gamma-glutamate biosynthesis protein PgsC/CapC [Thermovirga lienii]|jgi:poly-gamma-glutamate biosynthesis protein PgsC/CapC|uniref:poly-gamma-glutamate biosynthesis protein PgsC/CapC n=1 Tax=Thermovirga lienii TaxID=336261 RepID=UPI000EE83329|nr:capsule biosynthesis protein CapC [Thermovirga lienii]
MSPSVELGLLFFGVALGLIWTERTGFSTGGIITPGFLAASGFNLKALSVVITVSLPILLLLEVINLRFAVYGRRRVGLAIGLSLLFFWCWSLAFPLNVPWSGWIVPGLLASDSQRQGFLPTLSGALACGACATLLGRLLI